MWKTVLRRVLIMIPEIIIFERIRVHFSQNDAR